ncbi:MAG: ATP synthase subunit I [Gracilibacteraceae bacterium]|jgi:hypothetical protein|nr:ATP synthase subunit I [Gracilibacteraceae bacterium]
MSLRQIFVTEAAALAVALALAAVFGDWKFAGFFAGYTVGMLNHLLLSRDARQAVEMTADRALVKYAKGLFLRLGFITLAMAACARLCSDWILPLAGGFALSLVAALAAAAGKIHAERG